MEIIRKVNETFHGAEKSYRENKEKNRKKI